MGRYFCFLPSGAASSHGCSWSGVRQLVAPSAGSGTHSHQGSVPGWEMWEVAEGTGLQSKRGICYKIPSVIIIDPVKLRD